MSGYTKTSLAIVAFIIITLSTVNSLANCPSGCQCNDATLVVQCGEGHLDVLPIALNPSIQRLVIKYNKIKMIDSSIQFYSELTFLDLSNNHLMNIPSRTFAYQRKLQELHLNHNKIGAVSNKTFQGMAALTVLNLRGNFLEELDQGMFSPLAQLEELNLGQNRISKIDPNAFTGLVNLRVLYLDDNTLTQVPSLAFQAIPTLAELFLGVNSFTTIAKGAFEKLTGLTKLDLRGAGLRNISHESLKGLEGVRVLDLSDNRLRRIPTVELSSLVRLEEFYLGQNDFEVVPEGAFVGLTNLRRLDVTGSLTLKRVDSGAFATNTNLEYLNLSANKLLTEVQEGALSGLPRLRHVLLRENALSTLAEGLFAWQDLHTLDLSNNPIHCDCKVLWVRNLLIKRNASSDSISDVSCETPERWREESLSVLSPELLGCSHSDARKQALIGALLVGSAATITAIALILFRCRRKIREFLKGRWGNSGMSCKEREYQKTFSDEEYTYMSTRHPHQQCNFMSFPNTYQKHPQHTTLEVTSSMPTQQKLQELQVPTSGMQMKPQPQEVAATGNQNYYSHAIVNGGNHTIGVHKSASSSRHMRPYHNGTFQHTLDDHYMHDNSHYSLPIYHDGPTRVAPTHPPPPPPALPQRNGSGFSQDTHSLRHYH